MPATPRRGRRVLSLEDYGPFKRVRVEFAELTVVIGRNSTGKSLAVYAYAVLSRALNPLVLLLYGGMEAVEDLGGAAKRYLEEALKGFTGRSAGDLVRLGAEEAVVELEVEGVGRVAARLRRGTGVAEAEVVYQGRVREVVDLVLDIAAGGPESPEKLHKMLMLIGVEAGLPWLLEAYMSPLVLPDSRSGVVKTVAKYVQHIGPLVLRRSDPDLELALILASLASTDPGSMDLSIVEPLLAELGVRKLSAEGQEVRVEPLIGPPHSLSVAASGVREALPLLLALAAKGVEELVVEEPEAHLHPAAVRSLARVFARAVNAGKRIVITTHSDILLVAINNLVMLGLRPERAEGMGYGRSELLNPQLLSAYATRPEEDHVVLEKLTIDETGIPEDEFSEVVRLLADERAEALP